MPAPLPRLNLLRTWKPVTKLGQEIAKCEPLAAMLERGSAPEKYAELQKMTADLGVTESREFVYRLMQDALDHKPDLRQVPMPRSHWLQWLAKQGHFSWKFEESDWSEGEFSLHRPMPIVMWLLRAKDGSSLQYAMRSNEILRSDQGEMQRRSIASLPLFACISSDSKLVMPAEGDVWLHLHNLPPQHYKVVSGLSQGANGQLESVARNTHLARKLVFAFVQRV